MTTEARTLIGPAHAHLDAPCTDACYESDTTTDADRIRAIDERLKRVEKVTTDMLATMQSAEAAIRAIIAEVKPTIDELMGSSFIKMLGIKKKS